MFDLNLRTFELADTTLSSQSSRHRGHHILARQARALHRRTCYQGWWRRLWSRVTGGNVFLLNLETLVKDYPSPAQHYAGIHSVPLERIKGSEGRGQDFDKSFCPTSYHTQERWVSVAYARMQGLPLPPVQLIQAGDAYYVRDGHHRISVARAMGCAHIDAEVTVWESSGRPHRQQPLSLSSVGAAS